MSTIVSYIASTISGIARVLPHIRDVHEKKAIDDMQIRQNSNNIDTIIIKLHRMSAKEKKLLVHKFLNEFEKDYSFLCIQFERLVTNEMYTFKMLLKCDHTWSEPLQFLLDYGESPNLSVVSG